MKSAQSLESAYDVIVAGAGPAGGECARELAKSGINTLLLERARVVGEPNFSSGGTVKETMEKFELPKSIIQSRWYGIMVKSRGEAAEFDGNEHQGYVIDYKRLTRFLFNDAKKNGADVATGSIAQRLIRNKDGFSGLLVNGKKIRAKLIIDATGTAARLGREAGLLGAKGKPGTGVEHLMQGIKLKNNRLLQFYLGDFYAPGGYLWVFPAGGDLAKIGIVRLLCDGISPPRSKLDLFIRSNSETEGAKIIDTHGGAFYYDPTIKNYTKANLMLVGDAARLCNPLGGEGIRHAMASGRFAAQVCSEYLKDGKGDQSALKRYDKLLRAYTGGRWDLSYKLAKIGYSRSTDANADRMVRFLKKMTLAEVIDILFNYRFPKWRLLSAMLGVSRR